MSDTDPLDTAIADLERRRAVLGDAVVDAAVAAMRAQRDAARRAMPRAASARVRQVSILFADIADSTALLEGLAADEALTLVSEAQERFAAQVRALGGDVLRFTGDGLKAAFGAQGTRGDEAERAVRAGLAILREAEHHAQRLSLSHRGRRFAVRVGVHSGPVVLGAGAEADQTAMGHAVHLAARMEQSAPLGGLRISQETWVQVRGLFDADEQPALQVKGHAQPLVTYLVSRERPVGQRGSGRGLDGVHSPLIGREAEMAAVLKGVEQVRAQREAAVVWVIGDAGLGKTRLREETLGHAVDATVMSARAHPMDTLQPYGLLRRLLARWCAIPDNLEAQAACERFEQVLTPCLGPDGATRARRLGHLLGLDFGRHTAVAALGGRELREQGFLAWRDILRHLAAQSALLIVALDDLHWADDASVELVQRLSKEPGAPMLLLLQARPALLERHAPSDDKPHVRVLRLAPLGSAGGAALADALLAPLETSSEGAAAVRGLLVERAEGNPFFMEELLRMLIDRGAVITQDQPWRIDAARLDATQVPATLVGVLQSRLDALPADELAALQHASVVGSVFWDAVLQQLDADATSALPALQQRSLVRERAGSTFSHTAERAFQHALLHDVTYGTVLTAARREGHARVARWLETQMLGRAAEFLTETATHFERAGESARAFEYYERARQAAADRYAYSASLALADRSLALDADVPPRQRFLALMHRATALEHLGRGAESQRALDDMEAYAQARDDDAMRADVRSLRMLQADHEGRPDEAREHALRAIELVRRDGRPHAAGAGALAFGELAWLAIQRGEYDQVPPYIEAGITYARQAAQLPRREGGYGGYETQLRCIEVHALAARERYAEAAEGAQRAMDAMDALLARSVRDSTPPTLGLLDRFHLTSERCSALHSVGDLEGATQAADAAQALAAQIDMPRTRAGALALRARLAVLRRDAEAARRTIDEIERICQSIGFAQHLMQVHEWRGELAEQAGDTAAALDSWRQLGAYAREQGDDHGALAADCRGAALLLEVAADPERPAALAAGLQVVDQALAAMPGMHAMPPRALLACHDVLRAAGDARAGAVAETLHARLAAVLAQCADAAARERLLDLHTHWRRVAALHPPAPGR